MPGASFTQRQAIASTTKYLYISSLARETSRPLSKESADVSNSKVFLQKKVRSSRGDIWTRDYVKLSYVLQTQPKDKTPCEVPDRMKQNYCKHSAVSIPRSTLSRGSSSTARECIVSHLLCTPVHAIKLMSAHQPGSHGSKVTCVCVWRPKSDLDMSGFNTVVISSFVPLTRAASQPSCPFHSPSLYILADRNAPPS